MDRTELGVRWAGLLAGRGGPAEAVGRLGDELLAAYAGAERSYHSLGHLVAVLTALDELADLAADPAVVELAAWFHDVVYDPRAAPGANEAASAVRAAEALRDLGVPAAVVGETARLIRLTATHTSPAPDTNGAVLLDADLAVLGADVERYRRYVAGVRAEYAFVDDNGWRAGRSALLRGLLARPRLFVTDRARDRWEAAARSNLAAELASLGG